MAQTDYQIKIRQLRDDASNEQLSPKERILAARGALRVSGHNDRSLRVAKRVAKQFMSDEKVGPDIQLMATRLLNFCLQGAKASQKDSADEQPKEQSKPQSKVPPLGATHTGRGEDGKMHYTNLNGDDLGLAE
ncbi:MAG: hypothetical protein ACYDCM_07280 [Candidatus Acidiferrales bacterium]